MPKLPVVKPKEVIKAIKKAGFTLHHIKGSHHYFFDPTKTFRVTIAYHNKDLKPKTLSGILDQAQLSIEEFNKLR